MSILLADYIIKDKGNTPFIKKKDLEDYLRDKGAREIEKEHVWSFGNRIFLNYMSGEEKRSDLFSLNDSIYAIFLFSVGSEKKIREITPEFQEIFAGLKDYINNQEEHFKKHYVGYYSLNNQN